MTFLDQDTEGDHRTTPVTTTGTAFVARPVGDALELFVDERRIGWVRVRDEVAASAQIAVASIDGRWWNGISIHSGDSREERWK